jgi:uncharacterized protein (DUF2141 family)
MEAKTMRYSSSHPLFAVLLTACAGVGAGELRVEISNAQSDTGKVYFALFDSAAGYDGGRPHAKAVSRIGDDRPFVVFTDLSPGDYAVTVFQDRNANRRLDTNLLGIPTEPYGFSRNAMGRMGRPDFAAAAVRLPAAEDNLVIDIELRSQP